MLEPHKVSTQKTILNIKWKNELVFTSSLYLICDSN